MINAYNYTMKYNSCIFWDIIREEDLSAEPKTIELP